MSEWNTYKWGDLISLEYGKPIPDKNLLDGQYPVYGTNGRIGTSNLTPLCKHPSIIVGRKGAYRGVHYSNKPFSVIDTAFFVEPKTSILDLKWAYYKLLTVNINKMDSGSAIPSTDRYEIYSLSVELPPLEEQRQIAGILGSLDDKIELNRRINANLEAQAQALFRSWFVDFEPFHDGPFVDSELGKIPQGWKVIKLDDIANIYTGYSYKGNELQESNIGMATIKNFDRNGTFKIDGYKSIKPSIKLKQEQNITLFDIIVAHTDLTQNADIIGNPALVFSKGPYSNLIMSMDLSKVVSKQANINNFLLFCILKDIRFKNHILGYVNGTTVLHLSKKAIPEYKIALPTKDLDKISKMLESLYMKISNNYSENEKLTTLRDTLLPKLMAGEINLD